MHVRRLLCFIGRTSDVWIQEARSIPAQIDEAAKYIKYLEATVNEAKKKKERLMVGKRLQHSTTDHCNTRSSALETSRSPKLDIRVRGSTLEVTLVSGTCSRHIFSDVIRVLHEGRAQVLNANVSVTGNSVYHLMHAEVIRMTGILGFREINRDFYST